MPSSRLLPPPSFPTRRSSDLSRRPEPEGAVDVEPRPRLGGCVRDRIEVVERPGVDLARLPAHDRRPLAEPKGIDLHPSLVVRRDDVERARPDPEKPQRTVDGGMPLRADDDADRRRTGQPISL